MALPRLLRWGRGSDVPVRRNYEDENPILELHSEMNRLFDDFWRGFGDYPLSSSASFGWRDFQPRVDVEDTDTEIRVVAELPGMEEKDFDLQLERDALILRGEKREERAVEHRGLSQQERMHGRFERRIWLPCEIEADRVSAQYKQGVLTVTLPKSEEARRHRTAIPVKAG